ncbi:MAG TPA: protoporphyrinogen oxidase [Candidatus Corynebacterium avicola]|uniref:Coproporphyrinogen III oxidase n=1 Tax=Candidatus Corynebacterium avicola TaxID=2838527 RepID=A0A9D1UKC3_9CORY|nr:protoporphyrinogen oxidase [Candidatus Corynebacterium avicola]
MVGGGISGLAAAWELRRRLGPGAHIQILEAYDRIGGKLKTVDFSEGPVDMGAEAFLARRTSLAGVITELGLGDELRVPSGARSAFLVDGELVDIPSATVMGVPARGADVAEVLSPEARAAIDAERDGAPLQWTPGDDANVGDLVRQRYTGEVVDRLVSPMLGGVYSSSADDLGVRATIPQLADALDDLADRGEDVHLSAAVRLVLDERAASASSTDGKPAPVFNSLATGYRTLVNRFAEASAADIRVNTQVESIGHLTDRIYLEPVGRVDAVVVAVPAPTASVLLQDIVPDAAAALDTVKLASSAVVGLAFDTSEGLPERSGILIGQGGPTQAKAFTFSSRKWPHIGERGTGDGAFVRASFGTFRDPSLVDAEDRTLIGYALEDLAAVTGFTARPVETFVQRWWGGLPVYGEGHPATMDAVRRAVGEVPRVAVAGAYLDGVGVPACVEAGRAAAEKIIADLA